MTCALAGSAGKGVAKVTTNGPMRTVGVGRSTSGPGGALAMAAAGVLPGGAEAPEPQAARATAAATQRANEGGRRFTAVIPRVHGVRVGRSRSAPSRLSC